MSSLIIASALNSNIPLSAVNWGDYVIVMLIVSGAMAFFGKASWKVPFMIMVGAIAYAFACANGYSLPDILGFLHA